MNEDRSKKGYMAIQNEVVMLKKMQKDYAKKI
jgi:hypothetical protein